MIEDILGREYLLKNHAKLKAFLEEKGYPLSDEPEIPAKQRPEFGPMSENAKPRFWSALDDKKRGF